MTIRELIEELEKIDDKELDIKFWNGETYQVVHEACVVYSPWTGTRFIELD